MKTRFIGGVVLATALFILLILHKPHKGIADSEHNSASVTAHSAENALKKTEPVKAATNTSTLMQSSSGHASLSEESPTVEQRNFEIQLSQTMDQMPTLSQQKKPSFQDGAQIHGFIPEEFREAEILAKLHKLSAENMKYASLTQKTYAGCSERADLSNAVRAVCFVNALKLSLKLKNSQKMVMLDVPVNIREIARKIAN